MDKEKIKDALLNRDFTRAQALILEWAQAVKDQLKSTSAGTERNRIFEEARTFAEGNIYLTRVIRAHIGAELQANSASFLYRETDLEQHRWQVKA